MTRARTQFPSLFSWHSAHKGSVWILAQVTKMALKPLDMQQTKDIETAVAGIRADKLKEKTAADAAKKGALLALALLAAGLRLAF